MSRWRYNRTPLGGQYGTSRGAIKITMDKVIVFDLTTRKTPKKYLQTQNLGNLLFFGVFCFWFLLRPSSEDWECESSDTRDFWNNFPIAFTKVTYMRRHHMRINGQFSFIWVESDNTCNLFRGLFARFALRARATLATGLIGAATMWLDCMRWSHMQCIRSGVIRSKWPLMMMRTRTTYRCLLFFPFYFFGFEFTSTLL